MKNIEQFISELKQSESFRLFEDEMAATTTVGNTTSNVVGYDTPKAFSDKDEEDHAKEVKKSAEVYGYREVGKTKRKNFESVSKPDSTYKKFMGQLSEISYKVYREDASKTVNQKLNHSIKELNRAIYEVERVVVHASRLKTEMGVDQRTLWRASHAKLHKIGERLNRIGKKINELGA